jgi:hypothetical protein
MQFFAWAVVVILALVVGAVLVLSLLGYPIPHGVFSSD